MIERAAQIARANAGRGEPRPIGSALAMPPVHRGDGPAVVAPDYDRDRAARIAKLAEACGVPKRYRGGSLDDLSAIPAACRGPYAQAVARLRLLAGTPGVVAALLGPRGPGKTHMACGLVQEFCRAGRSAVYLHVMDYFQALKATYADKARADESAVERRYLRFELLVLDEIHERGETAWEDRTLTRLISKRYDDRLTTVLVSNQTRDEFAVRIGETIASRITDGGGVIACDWASLRGRIQDGGRQ